MADNQGLSLRLQFASPPLDARAHANTHDRDNNANSANAADQTSVGTVLARISTAEIAGATLIMLCTLILDAFLDNQSELPSRHAAGIINWLVTNSLRLQAGCYVAGEDGMAMCGSGAPDQSASTFQQAIYDHLSGAVMSSAAHAGAVVTWAKTRLLVAELRSLPPHMVHIHHQVHITWPQS